MVVFRVLIVAYFCDLWFLVVFGVLNFAYFCDLQTAVFWDVKFCLFLMILTIWRKIGAEMECLGMKWHERWWILVKSALKHCIIHYLVENSKSLQGCHNFPKKISYKENQKRMQIIFSSHSIALPHNCVLR